MAEKEIILIQTSRQTEVTKYLVNLFRELERLHPTKCGAMSHGIAWDDKRERLVCSSISVTASTLIAFYPTI